MMMMKVRDSLKNDHFFLNVKLRFFFFHCYNTQLFNLIFFLS